MPRRRALVVSLPLLVAACAAKGAPDGYTNVETGELPDAAPSASGDDASFDGGSVSSLGDATTTPPVLTPDAACATVSAEAKTEALPVDIVWMVDNSVSMAPAVAQVRAGLNAFAQSIGAKSLDYKVIMLSLRDAATTITVSGSTRYPVCIAPPLSGDSNCGNGPRFFQSNIDIKSTQPLEQFLGTMDHTKG